MKAYLMGGPANGRVIPHPRLHLYRHLVPKPIDSLTIQDCLQESLDLSVANPNFDVADYRFTGRAIVNLNDDIDYVIYQFDGMEPA